MQIRVLRMVVVAFLAIGMAVESGCGDRAGKAPQNRQAAEIIHEPRPHTANEALELLLQGNQRFVTGHASHPDEDSGWRHELVNEQHPFVTLLGCSDSRMPPELLFDQGFGDMFVIRVAGNIVDPYIEGSIEYGVHHLHTHLLLVLGHEGCGALKAAMESADDLEQEPAEIKSLLKAIKPSLASIPGQGTPPERLHAAVEANVRRMIDELFHLPALQTPLEHGELQIVGGVYDLETGCVRVLP